jgi:hypothetical protein
MTEPRDPTVGSSGPSDPSGRWRPRRWQLAASVLVGALVALVLAAAAAGASLALGLRGAPSAGAAQVAAADTLDTAAARLGPPPAEWREQVALGWSQLRERPAAAADHFRRAILVEEARAEAWRGLGLALLSVDDRAGARDALCTARGRARRRSVALEQLLVDEELSCRPAEAGVRDALRRARTPSP